MDTNRDSVHQSQNELDFPTFSLGLEFLKEAEREKTNGKGDSASLPSRFAPGGGTPRKIGWGCSARFSEPLPYLWPKSATFPTLFMTWLLIKTLFLTYHIHIKVRVQKSYPIMTKMAEIS